MTRRTRNWILGIAGVFTLGNLAGVFPAAMAGEPLHASTHVALMLVGGFVFWRVLSRSAARDAAVGAPSDQSRTSPAHALAERLTRLEQSLGAMATEVERVGEGQRFMTQLYADQRERSKADLSAPKEHQHDDS